MSYITFDALPCSVWGVTDLKIKVVVVYIGVKFRACLVTSDDLLLVYSGVFMNSPNGIIFFSIALYYILTMWSLFCGKYCPICLLIYVVIIGIYHSSIILVCGSRIH